MVLALRNITMEASVYFSLLDYYCRLAHVPLLAVSSITDAASSKGKETKEWVSPFSTNSSEYYDARSKWSNRRKTTEEVIMAVSTTGFRCMSDSTVAAAAAAAAAAAITSPSNSVSAAEIMCSSYNTDGSGGGGSFTTTCNPFWQTKRGNPHLHPSSADNSMIIASTSHHGHQDSRMAEKIVSELQVRI